MSGRSANLELLENNSGNYLDLYVRLLLKVNRLIMSNSWLKYCSAVEKQNGTSIVDIYLFKDTVSTGLSSFTSASDTLS